MLQLPSDSSFPFILLKGAGQAWPSADACDVRSEWPRRTDRDEEESEGHLLAELEWVSHWPLFNRRSWRSWLPRQPWAL